MISIWLTANSEVIQAFVPPTWLSPVAICRDPLESPQQVNPMSKIRIQNSGRRQQYRKSSLKTRYQRNALIRAVFPFSSRFVPSCLRNAECASVELLLLCRVDRSTIRQIATHGEKIGVFQSRHGRYEAARRTTVCLVHSDAILPFRTKPPA